MPLLRLGGEGWWLPSSVLSLALPPLAWAVTSSHAVGSPRRCACSQSCLTLCDPMNRSPPVSSVHGIFPGKNTAVGCCFLLQGIFLTQGWNLCPLHLQVNYYFFFLFNWRIIALQSCAGFCTPQRESAWQTDSLPPRCLQSPVEGPRGGEPESCQHPTNEPEAPLLPPVPVPQPHQLSDETSQGWELDCPLMRGLKPEALSHVSLRLLTPRNCKIIGVCWFKLWNCGVILGN